MTPARSRQARLARILAVRKGALRASEARLGAAGARARLAEARIATVQTLIATAATDAGESGLAALRGGATLRGLLRPALEAATAQAQETGRSKALAARQLAEAEARHSRALRDVAEARAAAEIETEERESAERIPHHPEKHR